MFSRLQNKRHSQYSRLEDRRLLAGDVAVVEDVHLYIRGDQADNQFEIVEDSGNLRINGLEGTTINGQPSYLIRGTQQTASGLIYQGGIRAHLGPGNDAFKVVDALFESFTIIYGGTGDDSIEIIDAVFADKTVIQTFSGDDVVAASGTHFNGELFAITLEGDDTVTLTESVLGGNSYLVTGEHQDLVNSTNNHYLGETNLVLPADGDDSVHINDPVVSTQLGVFLGDGDDRIEAMMLNATLDGTVVVSGQEGVDRANMEMADTVEESVSARMIEATGELVYQGLDGDYWEGIYAFLEVPNDALRTPAQQVRFAENTQVYSLAFSGSFSKSYPNTTDSYTIRILGSENDVDPFIGEVVRPSEEVYFESIFTVDQLNQTLTDSTWTNGWGRDVATYEMTAELDFVFEAGKEYWVSLHQNLSMQDTLNEFHWVNGANSTRNFLGYYDAPVGWQGNPTDGGGEEMGYAFELRA